MKLLTRTPQGLEEEVISLLSSDVLNEVFTFSLTHSSPLQFIRGIMRLGSYLKFSRHVNLNQRIDCLVQENMEKISRLMQSNRASLTKPKYFVSLNPEEIVRQCSLTMQYLFKQIPSREFLSPHYKDCSNIQNLRKFKDRVSASPLSDLLFLTSKPHDSLFLVAILLRE